MTDRRDRDPHRQSSSDLQRAMERLEEAIADVVRSTTDDLSGKAAAMLDETSRRLRGEQSEMDAQRGARARRRASLDEMTPKTRKLYRDPHNRRIAGVCAGYARYFGFETWVARLLALTALLFMPGIALPAYFISYLFMEKAGRSRSDRVNEMRTDHRSPAPEFGSRFAPRRSLRQVQADLTDAELKLRRMETHVTSDQYSLRREIDALDRGAH